MTTTKDVLSSGEFEQKSLEILQRIDAEFRRTAIDFRRGDADLELWWCPGSSFDTKQLGEFAKPQRVGKAIRIVEMVYNDDELLGEEERVQTSDYVIEVDISEKQTLATVLFNFSETEPVTFRADASEFWELSQSRRLASEFELTRKLNTGCWSWLVEELQMRPRITECVFDNFEKWPEL